MRLTPAQMDTIAGLYNEIAGEKVALELERNGLLSLTTNPEARECYRREWLIDREGRTTDGLEDAA